MKKLIAALLFVLLACSTLLAGCANDGKTAGGEYIITVYRVRSSGMVDGTDDDKVTAALEKKFKEDTGIGIKLNMIMENNDSLPQKVDLDYGKANQPMDLVYHYVSEDLSGSAVMKYAKEAESVVELSSLMEEYAPDLLAKIRENDTDHVAERSGYVMQTDGSYKNVIIPTHTNESVFSILIRKDLMKKVQNKTGLDPEDYDIANEGYQNLSLKEFENLLIEMKAAEPSVSYSISGYPWDIERVISPALGVDGRNYAFDENGKLVPPQLGKGFGDSLQLMYDWISKKIYEPSSNNLTETQMRSNFLTGKSAAFICYPEVENLIEVVRTAQAMNQVPNAEYMLLAPLASVDSAGNTVMENGKPKVNGFIKNPRSFCGSIIPRKSKHPEITLQFLNWLASDPENYELAKYGIKGEHWIEGDEKTIGGVTYQTWEYPPAKSEEFKLKPPYSGKWDLIENINVSNRLRGDMNTQESRWYAAITYEFPTFSSGIEGIWLPKADTKYSSAATQLEQNYVTNVRGNAWTGEAGAGGKNALALWRDYNTDIRKTAAEYLQYIDESYHKVLDAFHSKFGG